MKLDNEQVSSHGAVDHKSSCKHLEYSSIDLDSTRIDSGYAIVNGEREGSFGNLKGVEDNVDHLQDKKNDQNKWNASELDHFVREDVSTEDNVKEVSHVVASTPLTRSSLRLDSFERDSVFYVDKSVMEPELPELVVCYKENTYHVIKDICIDEGVPSKDKFLFDTIDEKNLLTFLSPEKHKDSEVVQETVECDTCNPDSLKSLPEDEKLALHSTVPDVYVTTKEEDDSKHGILLHDSQKFTAMGKVEDDTKEEIANDKSKEIFSLGELFSMPEVVDGEVSQPKSSDISMDEAKQHSLQGPSENTTVATASGCDESEKVNEQSLSVSHVVSAAEVSEGHRDEEISRTHDLDSAAKALDNSHEEVLASPLNSETKESGVIGEEENTSRIGDELSYDCNVKSKSINFDSKSSIAKENIGDEGSQNSGSEPHSSRHETITDLFSSQLHYGPGESSFSASVPVSGLITYSGPIAYSGSLSLRSDSSTTSNRSFAFPILQSEWNSSPVRMAKADRRHLRKQKSWRQGLLCCRF